MSVTTAELIDEYVHWLRQRISSKQVGEWVEINTPFLDRHNDFLQVYMREEPTGYFLSDDGYIVHDLRMSGCELDTKNRQLFLRQVLNGLGVKRDENTDALTIQATRHNFAAKKHSLVQAMLAVNDMFYLASPFVANLFFEEVRDWLRNTEIRFVDNIKFVGHSGFDHRFDFVIPASNRSPMRIIRAINRPAKDAVLQLSFAVTDTKEARDPDCKAYALLNDSQRRPDTPIIEALKSYDIEPILWSERVRVRNELAA